MQYKNQLTYSERGLPKAKLPRKNSLKRNLLHITAGLIISGAILGGTGVYDKIQKQRIKDAFSGNCGKQIIDIRKYNEFGSDAPYAIALEEALKLRESYPNRFGKISNENMANEIMKNYNDNTHELTVPKFNCGNPQ